MPSVDKLIEYHRQQIEYHQEELNELIDSIFPGRFVLYPFFDDETATMFDTPFSATDNLDIEELSLELRLDLLEDCYGGDMVYTREQMAEWSEEMQYQFLWDKCTLLLNKVAIVPKEHRAHLKRLCDSLWKTCEGDSSTYRACETYNEELKELAVHVIDIPVADLDREGEFEYE